MTPAQTLQSAARLLSAGDLHGATQLVSALLATHPGDANALRLMGVIALHAGNPASALDYLHRALDAEPRAARSHGTLASALLSVGRLDDAAAHAARSVELDSAYADGHVILGLVRTQRGELTAAIESLRRAINLRPADSSAHNVLGNALSTAGRIEEAIAAYRESIRLNPGNSVADDNLLLALNHHVGDDAATMFAQHAAWSDRHAPAPAKAFDFAVDRDPHRRLRIAYLSPDFRRHAVSCFFEPLLAAHDRQRVHVTLYANVQVEDEVSARLRNLADDWVNVAALSDQQLLDRIRADRIDVAIDLAGHTAGNRLRALAGRAAPIQVSYLGYPNTTGVRAVDLLITDTDLDPPRLRTDRWHVEQLIRLPRTMHAYRPPDEAPDLAPRPAGAIRFGSFNRLEKLTPRTLDLFSAALRAVPRAMLVIKTPALSDADTSRRVSDQLADRGVHPARVTLLGRDPTPAEHLARYRDIDIALDSYPYNGTTTTCEALWMGVPVITLEGPTRVARTTGGILRAINLPELCADDEADFARIAAALAADSVRLRQLRTDLRRRMTESPLMRPDALAGEVESALRSAWTVWCARCD